MSKTTFPEVFRIKISFLHLISNGLNGVNYQLTEEDCGFVAFFCVVYLVKEHNDLLSPKPNVIRKLPYKVIYISQINGGLIFFWKFFWKFLNYLARL